MTSGTGATHAPSQPGPMEDGIGMTRRRWRIRQVINKQHIYYYYNKILPDGNAVHRKYSTVLYFITWLDSLKSPQWIAREG